MSEQPLTPATPPLPAVARRNSLVGIGSLDFATIVQLSWPALTSILKFWALWSVMGALFLLWVRPAYALPFLGMSGAPCMLLWLWKKKARATLPMLPVFALQNAVIYGTPLMVRNESLLRYSDSLLPACITAYLIFMGAVALGWRISAGASPGVPSRWRFGLPYGVGSWPEGLRRSGILLLAASFGFELVFFSGLYWTLLGARAWGMYSLIRTLFDAASLCGALMGGFAGNARKGRFAYWSLMAGLFFFKISGILISNAQGLVVAASLGLLLGTRKIPWKFLLITFSLVAFLNQSKFIMRSRYWEQQNVASVKLTLVQLPAFYLEWTTESVAIFLGREYKGAGQFDSQGVMEEGQSFYDRIDNLQNLLFVVEAMKVFGLPSLQGKSYILIPPLFIPRFLWADKPLAHKGQSLLNVHFGRQASSEETEKTYVAWGILPEAMGNLGLSVGPLLVGLAIGILIQRIEIWFRRKQLMSVEGLIGVTLLLQTAISFEMVAGIFLTSTFQFLLAVTAGGLIVRSMVLNGRPSAL